jgi:diaminopimelate epimerase
MTIPCRKIPAAGNEFVLIENRSNAVAGNVPAGLARRVSDRKFGIGSDGLILLEDHGGGELIMHYKNPDGSDAGMCGNGARCFVKFAHSLGFGNEISFRVHDKSYNGSLKGEQIVIEFPLTTKVKTLELDGETLYQVYTNTEHVVCPVSPEFLEEEKKLVDKGRFLRNHKAFSPKGTNVNFMSGTAEREVELQTYERGVEDLTLACGTGAIATALAWHHQSKGNPGRNTMDVQVKGGTLFVHFTFQTSTKEYQKISLEGPAVTVFEGTYYT